MVVPDHRIEFGLEELAHTAQVPYEARPVVLVTGAGLEGARASLRPWDDVPPADVLVMNTSAIVAAQSRAQIRIQMVREWLRPELLRHRVLTAFVARRSNAIVGISSGVLQQWAACTRIRRHATLVPNWLEPSWVESLNAPETPREGIVCVGRFNSWKGQRELVEAYASAFARSRERPSLTLVGAEPAGSPFAERAAQIQESGAALGVRVAPFTPDPRPFLRSAALLVVPSMRPEPFGNVVLEALVSGCRVVAFEGGGPSDLQRCFPHAVETVPRATGHLSDALFKWWKAGALGQSRADVARTSSIIERDFSERRADDQWAGILHAVASS
jgi:glycosyltransferase involved in cell wall biosynthesis